MAEQASPKPPKAGGDAFLPRVIADAGLGAITEHRRLRTGMGTLALFSTPAVRRG